MSERVLLKGAPGSPYTRKMLAVLRYRHIPYEFLSDQRVAELGLPEPKVKLLPTFYLPNTQGEIEAVVDSTPLIRRFETEYSARSVVPDDPALAFLNYLIEDYGDEWLTKAMFHYRWYYQDDIEQAGKILPLWRNLSMPAQQLQQMSQFISERQISRLYVVGSNDTTAPVIEDSYKRFLTLFDNLLQRQTFVLGTRPAAADFAIYAQLTQLAKFDPTPARLCLANAPRVYAWTDVVEDLSGYPASQDAWLARDQVAEVLGELLAEIGRVYAPALLANATALQRGEEQMQTSIDGRTWIQPTFPYQAKCLFWIRQEFSQLGDADREFVSTVLAGTGCEALLQGV